MRCSLRRLTYVVSILLLLSQVFGAVLKPEDAKAVAVRALIEEFGKRVKVEDADVYLAKPIEYTRLSRVELSVREGYPKGSVHIYLRTAKGTRKVSVLLNLLWKCEVLTVLERIPRGERVYPWKVSVEERFMGRCPRQDLSHGELVNYITLKELFEGEVLKKSYLKREPLVRRGERVSVFLKRGNIEISFTGEALENGFLGDRVRVRFLGNGRVLWGRVVGEGKVLIR